MQTLGPADPEAPPDQHVGIAHQVPRKRHLVMPKRLSPQLTGQHIAARVHTHEKDMGPEKLLVERLRGLIELTTGREAVDPTVLNHDAAQPQRFDRLLPPDEARGPCSTAGGSSLLSS